MKLPSSLTHSEDSKRAVAKSTFNPHRKFARIINTRPDGLIEFEFALGEPQLFVEMLMHRTEFTQFCEDQNVVPTEGGLPKAEPGTNEHEWDWSLSAARAHHFRQET